ncbi:hypothetical protein QNI19_24245 [Cytophagaceae bacterium DM2B3-1]|uniref:Uncharacterized protein n=1 Tax=Xanthocytophaga flava TaxID=3048013 RepID=A0ABT7CQP2_9BACT|nr:hypothetical protein [Xanthocytophaga flavus]MDJ1496069.1 hypothetical protein [Xanthocytophaga flavus]
MSVLVIFGICIGIVILLLLTSVVLLGPGFFMVIIIVPTILAEFVTGQRGSFHPNGATRKARGFDAVLLLMLVVQVFLLAGILFGLYVSIFGIPVAPPAPVSDVMLGLDNVKIQRLILINTILWILAGSFVVMLLFNGFRFIKFLWQSDKSAILWRYILPVIGYLFAFLFLSISRKYLQDYPNGQISSSMSRLVIVYIGYLIFTDSNLKQVYRLILHQQISQFLSGYGFGLLSSLLYKGLFIYFTFRLLSSTYML